MDFFEKAFQWLAGVSQKLPVVNTKLFLIVTLAVILGVGVVIAFTLFASRARKLYVSSKKIRKYLANIDAVDDDNVSDFTAHCFSKKTPQPLRDAWVQYLGVRFGYPSDIVSDEVYDKFVKKNKDVRSGIFLAISLILLGVFAFWGYGTMRGANMGAVHFLALLLIGVIYLVLILLARKQNQRCLETFEAMQEDLDAKVNLQIESNYATDSSPLQELNALVEEIIARNTAKAIDDDESEQTPIEALIEQKMQEDEDFEEDEQESIDELLNAQEDETLAEEETPVEDESPVEEETPAEEVESPVECESDEASEEVAEDNAESEVEGEIEDETAFEDVADEQDGLSDSEDEADNQEGGFEVVEDEQEENADEPQNDVEETEDEINESHEDEVAEPQEDEQVELQDENSENGEDLVDDEADAEDESGEEQQDVDNADEVPQDEIAEEESDDENVDAEEQVNEEDFEQTEESDESEIVDETEESGKTEKSEETEESDEIEESEENAEDEDGEESEELEEAQEDDEPEVVYVVEGDEDDEENVKPAKLVKLPNLIDYMLSKDMPKAMKIQIATMLITTYNKFKDSPQDRKIVVSCLSKVMRDLQSNK